MEVSIWLSPQGLTLAHVGEGQKSPHWKRVKYVFGPLTFSEF